MFPFSLFGSSRKNTEAPKEEELEALQPITNDNLLKLISKMKEYDELSLNKLNKYDPTELYTLISSLTKGINDEKQKHEIYDNEKMSKEIVEKCVYFILCIYTSSIYKQTTEQRETLLNFCNIVYENKEDDLIKLFIKRLARGNFNKTQIKTLLYDFQDTVILNYETILRIANGPIPGANRRGHKSNLNLIKEVINEELKQEATLKARLNANSGDQSLVNQLKYKF